MSHDTTKSSFMHEDQCDGEFEYDALLEEYVCPRCGKTKPHNGNPPKHEKYVTVSAQS